MASFIEKDGVQGTCYKTKNLMPLGKEIKIREHGEEQVLLKINKIKSMGFDHPEYKEHLT